ncbi:hypothetical protein SB775_18095 [Peribacillus sp. SIMBA_075]|uniref:hypothetical protein n=1 Tax=Peribacillus sp. SIMBA_075 TaxID=3085813 RepID=UPI00397B6438
MKLINCYTFYLRILARTWVVPILFLGILIYGSFTFFVYSSLNDPYILSANPLVLALMICYLFIGIYLAKIDEKEEIYETFCIIKNAVLYKTLAKWLLILSSVVLITVLFFVVYLYLFFTKDFNNKTYFLSVLKYIWLYWGLSSFIMFLLGNLLSLWIRGKFVYLIALTIYVFTMPLNYVVFNTEGGGPSKFRIDKILNLGEPNITRGYNSLYGFSIDTIHWDKKLLIISLLIILFLLTWKNRMIISKSQLKYSIIPMLVILVGSVAYVLQPLQVLSDDDDATNRYYREHKISVNDSFGNPISFKKYDIELSTKANLNVSVKIQAISTATKDIKQIKLGLFHELHIHQVKMDGKEIKFKQKNDSVTLYFEDNTWKPNDNRILEFNYEGLQSNLYFGNAQAVYLPNYMPWLPSENSLPAFEIVTKYHFIHRVPHQPNDQKKYHLKVNGAKELYTNLTKTKEGTWEGTSTDGISLLSGQLSSKIDNNVTYVFPNTWESQFEHTDSIYNYLNDVTRVMKTTLKDDQLTVPRTIYFVPNQNISDGMLGEGTWWNNDYLIWGFSHIEYPFDPFFTVNHLGDFTPQLVLAKTKVSSHKEDFEFNILFSNVYGRALNNALQLPNERVESYLDLISNAIVGNQTKQKVKEQVNVWLKNKDSLNPESSVYKEWYSLIQHPTSQKWNKLYNVLKEENSK